MNKPEFYFGLPQDQWDNLIFKAEDLLRDEELGVHLVGIYPAGGRTFGIESESESIMCIYIDSVESIINPYPMKKQFVWRGLNMSSILMIELREWARQIISNDLDLTYRMMHAVPFGRHVFHQENIIDPILDIAHDIEKLRKFHRHYRYGRFNNYELRALAILSKDLEFSPCTNIEWDTVHPMPTDWTDEQYILEINRNIPCQIDGNKLSKLHKELGKRVVDIYRFQL